MIGRTKGNSSRNMLFCRRQRCHSHHALILKVEHIYHFRQPRHSNKPPNINPHLPRIAVRKIRPGISLGCTQRIRIPSEPCCHDTLRACSVVIHIRYHRIPVGNLRLPKKVFRPSPKGTKNGWDSEISIFRLPMYIVGNNRGCFCAGSPACPHHRRRADVRSALRDCAYNPALTRNMALSVMPSPTQKEV